MVTHKCQRRVHKPPRQCYLTARDRTIQLIRNVLRGVPIYGLT
jgi:hypothetical protein